MRLNIAILIDRSGPDYDPRFRATITVGSQEVAMPQCFSEDDSFNDAVNHLIDERKRGNYSKFALFHKSVSA